MFPKMFNKVKSILLAQLNFILLYQEGLNFSLQFCCFRNFLTRGITIPRACFWSSRIHTIGLWCYSVQIGEELTCCPNFDGLNRVTVVILIRRCIADKRAWTTYIKFSSVPVIEYSFAALIIFRFWSNQIRISKFGKVRSLVQPHMASDKWSKPAELAQHW